MEGRAEERVEDRTEGRDCEAISILLSSIPNPLLNHPPFNCSLLSNHSPNPFIPTP